MADPRGAPRLIQTFLYNGDSIVCSHLRVTYPHIDHIFIVEARETFSGHPKEGPLYHERHAADFAPFLDKITFLVIERFPDPPADWGTPTAPLPPYVVPGAETAWFRDIYAHEYARAFIRGAYDSTGTPYLVIAGDADEIPHPEMLERLRDPDNYAFFTFPVSLRMRHFCFSFDWACPEDWYHPTVLNREGLAAHSLSAARMGAGKTHCLPRGGWHCSYFGPASENQRKVASFAHRELDRPDHLDLVRAGLVPNTDYTDLPLGWEEHAPEAKKRCNT